MDIIWTKLSRRNTHISLMNTIFFFLFLIPPIVNRFILFFIREREERREKNLVTNRACHCMSLILVASWSNGNKRMRTTSISNFTICPTAVADRRKKEDKFAFLKFEKSHASFQNMCVCMWKKRMSYIHIFTENDAIMNLRLALTRWW
jgi:hypothetical protein